MSAEIQEQLCSNAKIERDKAYTELQQLVTSLQPEGIIDLQNDIQKLLGEVSDKWETKHGGLSGAKALLESEKSDDDFAMAVLDVAVASLDDAEFRVRIVAGEVLGVLCTKLGPEIFSRTRSKILDGIQSNLERQPLTDSGLFDQHDSDKLAEKLSSSPSRRVSVDAAQIFHDTAGWKSLETYMKCLQSMIGGCGYAFNEFVDQDLLDLVFSALTHTNRFVRETGFYVCSSLVSCGAKEGSETDSEVKLTEENAIYRHGHQFADHLGQGLADNWSQVRMAASTATRQFLMSLPTAEARANFYPVLISRMCLNRYYVAEGVRIYSQETWRLVTQGGGKDLVEKYIDNVVEYYVQATDSDNHAVREAACACIAELGSKIEKSAVSPHVSKLLETLLLCFVDDSWPVRDAACVACGNFVLCFPEESRGSLPALYPLFFNNLQDNIPSVRQGAAVALTNVVKAYGESSQETVLAKVSEGLRGLESQPATSEKYSGMDPSPATYSVAKQLRDNDMELHTDRQMYSCGSLAPKMGRGREGGCMDHMFRKPSEPWELADGCVSLLAELSHIASMSAAVTKLLPLVGKACTVRHYTHHLNFLGTVCKQLPNLAKGLGKRQFKTHLELFLEPIFYSLAQGVSWDNCIAFGSDNAPVMTGQNKGVFTFVTDKNRNVYLAACTLHLVHIGAKKGAACLPPVEEILVDIYYFFQKSTLRQSNLRELQGQYDVEQRKMLKHGCTRWLSIARCIKRLLESWEPLKHLFYKELKTKKAAEEKKRAEQPLIQELHGSLTKLLQSLFSRFMTPASVMGKELTEVPFQERAKQKEDKDLLIGDEAREIVRHPEEHHLRPERIQEFYGNVRRYFETTCAYLLKKLPLRDPLLQHARLVDPAKQLTATQEDLHYFLERYPPLLPAGASVETIEEQFSTYQVTTITDCIGDTVDKTWVAISKAHPDMKPLCEVMLGICTIPHSSAACERVFSCVRKTCTDQRASLGQDTVEALLVDSDNVLTSTAAGQTLTELSRFIGDGILRGRVEQFDPRYLSRLESFVGPPRP
ncbi:hypothetical protein ACOMHN_000365 [Nucella lapillus]